MPHFDDLIAAAYQTERVLARRRARHSGIPEAQALQLTLEQVAGAQGLAHLLTARAQLRHADVERTRSKQLAQAARLAQRAAQQQQTATAWRGWFDGSAHPNPGKIGLGVLLSGPAGQQLEISVRAADGDSSSAEYGALIALLEATLPLAPARLCVYGDSQVIIDDVLHMKAGIVRLAPQRARVHALLAQFPHVSLHWIPRHKNGAADRLSQRAISLPHASDEAEKESPASA